MNIFANIEGIKYKIKIPNELKVIDFKDFNINNIPSSCIIKKNKVNFAISKWVSPKRTRSYPFERVYNTLSVSKKLTVIPIIKDEGLKGDRDFIQWDTVSLMSLLDVYVIFAYYNKADKHKTRANKITRQQFENNYIISKINEISNYYSSALHWNLKEIKETLPSLIQNVKDHYSEIGTLLNVKFHNKNGIDRFQKQFDTGFQTFMETSRKKAKEAQNREQLTIQPKEILTTATKAKITIKNFLGGLYYLTTDEIEIQENKLYLIEAKHSKNAKLPNIGDIKDGLLKMILYCNLKNVKISDKNYIAFPILKLTSSKLLSSYKTGNSEEEKQNFFEENKLNKKQINLINNLLIESNVNNIKIIISNL